MGPAPAEVGVASADESRELFGEPPTPAFAAEAAFAGEPPAPVAEVAAEPAAVFAGAPEPPIVAAPTAAEPTFAAMEEPSPAPASDLVEVTEPGAPVALATPEWAEPTPAAPPPPAMVEPVEEAPVRPPATITLARLYIQQQQLPEAIEVLERLTRANPNDQEAADLLELVRDMQEPLPEELPPLSGRERKIAALQRFLACLTLGRDRAPA